MFEMSQFHFLRPWWLAAIIPSAILAWSFAKCFHPNNSWQHVCDPKLLPYLLVNPHTSSRSAPFAYLFGIWLIACLALAGPTVSKIKTPIYKSTHSRVLVVDLSPSMNATDIKPTRLARAKYKIIDLLKGFQEGFTGLVVFSQEAYAVSPLTDDTETIAALVPVLDPALMPNYGHNLEAGLKKALSLLKQNGSAQGQIIVITASEVSAQALKRAQEISRHGYSISVLGIGTPHGSPISAGQGKLLKNKHGEIIIAGFYPSQLKKLAQTGQGHYVTYSASNSDVETLLKIESSFAHQHQAIQQAKQSSGWEDQGFWLVLVLLPWVALTFRRGLLN